MEMTGMMGYTDLNIVERIFSKFRKEDHEKESYGMHCFVMKEKDAEDYRICEKEIEIEIRDGFNCNLVVQRYEKRKKIIIYIPERWQRKVSVKVADGRIFCRQKVPYQGLRLSVIRGEIICGEE